MDVKHFTNTSYSSPPHEDIINNKAQPISLMNIMSTSSGIEQDPSSLEATTSQKDPSIQGFLHSKAPQYPNPSSDNGSEYESENDFSEDQDDEEEGEKEPNKDDDSLDEPLLLARVPQNDTRTPMSAPSLKSPVTTTLRSSSAFGYSRIPRKPVGVGYSPQHALNRLEVENAYLINQNTSLNRDIQHCRNTVMALKQIVAQKEEIIERMRHEHRQACLKAKFMESVLAEYHDPREDRETTIHAFPGIQHKMRSMVKISQGTDDDDDLSYSDMDNSEFESDEDDYDDEQDNGDHENDYDGSEQGPPRSMHDDDHFVQISLQDDNHQPSSDTESEPSADSPPLRRRPRQSLSSVIPFGSSSRLQSTFSGFALVIPNPPQTLETSENDQGDVEHTRLHESGHFPTGINIDTTPDETASESTLTPTIKETDDAPEEKSNGDTFDPTTKNVPVPQPNSIGYTKTVTPPSIYLPCVNIEATVSSGSLSAEHSPSSEGGSTLPDNSPDQDSKDHLSVTSTLTTLPTDEDTSNGDEWIPQDKRGELNAHTDPETMSITSTSRPTSPSTILARLWQGVGRQTASLFGRRPSVPKSKHSSHNKGLSSPSSTSGVRVTKIGIRRMGSRSRFRSLTTSPVSVMVSGGVAMTAPQASLASKTLIN
ncbi:hypothetical protein MVEG_00268 [Podila verticillata NRRL 6337]|nr:hypothetical protein MVEG_00268 [Podila verticillata NRRL 6337]